MAKSTAYSQRLDPYKNFKFRVKWDGKYVAGVSKVGGLKRTTEVIKHREGGDPSTGHKSPGRTEYDAITLEQGLTHDEEFLQWANRAWSHGLGVGADVSLEGVKKDIILELRNEVGQPVISYKVNHCWVSDVRVQPDRDANSNAVVIKSMKLENKGWERD